MGGYNVSMGGYHVYIYIYIASSVKPPLTHPKPLSANVLNPLGLPKRGSRGHQVALLKLTDEGAGFSCFFAFVSFVLFYFIVFSLALSLSLSF